ncbi:zinc finger CCCH-type with G patch domain-containing protein isoform X1 [Ictidomys tridecemlineatus]
MDEESLETALQTYRAQLRQVELALGAGLEAAEQADLRQLQADLRELIGLTEASLVSVRKSKLLAALDAEAAGVPAGPEMAPEGEAGPGPAEPGRADPDPDPDPGELSGAKVNAPYRSAWGTLEYHNAMVVGTEAAEDGSAGVRVLYLYPTHKSLKPCPFFLEGKCRFKDSCRFSHGQVVSVDELRPFQDPDLSLLQAGSTCLAKHQDGLWHPARILVVESGTADTGTCSSAFAGWEVHTRGIGSRLLAKMGYEFGKGLGRHAEGRVEPIHAVVLPRGKSLDQCAEILQKRTKRSHAGASRPPRCQGSGSGPGGRPPPRNVFDFLNEKLQSQAPGALEAGAGPPGRRSQDMYHASKSAKQALSLRLFQTEEKIVRTQRDIQGIQEALTRNAGRHSVAAAQLEEKLAGAQRQLGQLRAQEAGLQREQRKADTHRKMTEF